RGGRIDDVAVARRGEAVESVRRAEAAGQLRGRRAGRKGPDRGLELRLDRGDRGADKVRLRIFVAVVGEARQRSRREVDTRQLVVARGALIDSTDDESVARGAPGHAANRSVRTGQGNAFLRAAGDIDGEHALPVC